MDMAYCTDNIGRDSSFLICSKLAMGKLKERYQNLADPSKFFSEFNKWIKGSRENLYKI